MSPSPPTFDDPSVSHLPSPQPMDRHIHLPPETDAYIEGTIAHTLGLPVPEKTLHLKLLASEDARRRLHDQVFHLQTRLRDAERRTEQYKSEASMTAQGLRRCIEEKEVLAARCAEFATQCSKLDQECLLYDKDIEKLMESCDELGRENEELKSQIANDSKVVALLSQVESLQKEKEHLRVNLVRAEDEVKVLYQENSALAEDNRRLHKQLNRERHLQGSGTKQSGSNSSKGKRNFDAADSSPRQPLSRIPPNSPDSRRQKK